MDTDGDGMLTAKEFKTGLRRLQYKQLKAWNLRMVRRLFDECDQNRDGLLSIREFSNYVLEIDSAERIQLAEKSKQLKQSQQQQDSGNRFFQSRTGLSGSTSENKLQLSDDEDDEVFRKNKVLTDHQLLKKVGLTLGFY